MDEEALEARVGAGHNGVRIKVGDHVILSRVLYRLRIVATTWLGLDGTLELNTTIWTCACRSDYTQNAGKRFTTLRRVIDA